MCSGLFSQLGERSERVACLGILGVVDFQQDRAIALHDERVGGVILHGLLAGRGSAVRPGAKAVMVDAPGLVPQVRLASNRRSGWNR